MKKAIDFFFLSFFSPFGGTIKTILIQKLKLFFLLRYEWDLQQKCDCVMNYREELGGLAGCHMKNEEENFSESESLDEIIELCVERKLWNPTQTPSKTPSITPSKIPSVAPRIPVFTIYFKKTKFFLLFDH